MVASQAQDGQQSDEAGEQPHRQHHGDGPTLGHGGEARKRAIDADETLHGHGGAEQQRAKAIKHHGHPHEVAEVAVWVQDTPVEARQMEGNHDGPRDQETGKVRDHQATQENQERGSGSVAGPVEGLGQNYESNKVGDEAQSAEGGRKVSRGDGALSYEGGAVDGVAERGVIGGGRGVHGGGVGGLEHHLGVMCFISLPNPEDEKRGNKFWGLLCRYSCEKSKKKQASCWLVVENGHKTYHLRKLPLTLSTRHAHLYQHATARPTQTEIDRGGVERCISCQETTAAQANESSRFLNRQLALL